MALKLLRDATTDSDARVRLQREARLAASVSHPAICQIYELAEIDGQLVLAMELLQGAPLAARLGQPFPPAEAVSTTLAIIGGLSALHERGIVHRDLKPSNIFITPHGVKLLDFGLARPVFPCATDVTLAVTEKGIGVGTPLYAAPEQLFARPFDLRADVYSLGAILFEMLTGRPPFSGATLGELIHAVVHEPAGLVHACRYCGLLRESVSAHQHARRFDPTVSTSVLRTYYVQRAYDRALDEAATSSDPLEARVLGATGRETEAIEAARREEARFAQFPRLAAYCEALRAAFEGRSSDVLAIAEPYDSSSVIDGEALFYWSEICARASLPGEALTTLERAADRGYMCSPACEGSPYLLPLHGMARFAALLERVRARQRVIAEQFTAAGGLALLS